MLQLFKYLKSFWRLLNILKSLFSSISLGSTCHGRSHFVWEIIQSIDASKGNRSNRPPSQIVPSQIGSKSNRPTAKSYNMLYVQSMVISIRHLRFFLLYRISYKTTFFQKYILLISTILFLLKYSKFDVRKQKLSLNHKKIKAI